MVGLNGLGLTTHEELQSFQVFFFIFSSSEEPSESKYCEPRYKKKLPAVPAITFLIPFVTNGAALGTA